MDTAQPDTSGFAVASQTLPASRRWSWHLAATLAALLLYLPHLLPLLGEHLSRDGSCRQSWLEHLPVMPGLWASSWLLFFVDVQAGGPRKLLAALLTVLALAGLAWLLTRGPRVRWISAAVATAFCVMNSGFLQVLFAM